MRSFITTLLLLLLWDAGGVFANWHRCPSPAACQGFYVSFEGAAPINQFIINGQGLSSPIHRISRLLLR